MFEAYKQFYYKIDPSFSDSKELLAEPVFFNDRFKIGKNTLNFKQWVEKDVYCVGHFLKENGDFLSHEEFTQTYNININFLTFLGCRQSIQLFIHKSGMEIKSNQHNSMNVCAKRFISKNKGCRQFYEVLVYDTNKPNCCNKWEQRLVGIIDWKQCFYNVHKINEINMKWFQIRVLHRIIGTNVVLKQMGIKENENCNFCDNVKDSIEHTFWECVLSQQFWTQFLNLVNEKCNNVYNMRFSKSLVLLGIDNNIKIDDTFYFILLLAKQYLYKCKLDSRVPDVNVFRKRLLYRYKIEEHNSKMNLSCHEFTTKWIMYKTLCADS